MIVAGLQMRAVAGDIDRNLRRIATAAERAAAAGARLLATPELALCGYGAGSAIRDLATPADGPVIDRLATLAERTGLALVVGFPERDGERVWNSAVRIGPTGDRTIYRKSHLYGGYEQDLFRPASPSAITFDLDGLRVGLLICYDVEFPENVRRLALAGAKLVVVPTALPIGPYATTIARTLISARAFENQLFVAYVNHCGTDPMFSYAGLSRIVAPDGTPLVTAGMRGEKLVMADIRPEAYAETADSNPYLRDLVM